LVGVCFRFDSRTLAALEKLVELTIFFLKFVDHIEKALYFDDIVCSISVSSLGMIQCVFSFLLQLIVLHLQLDYFFSHFLHLLLFLSCLLFILHNDIQKLLDLILSARDLSVVIFHDYPDLVFILSFHALQRLFLLQSHSLQSVGEALLVIEKFSDHRGILIKHHGQFFFIFLEGDL